MARTPPTLLLLLLLLVLPLALLVPETLAHRVSERARGTEEEKQKAEARNQAEKEKALRQVNEEEEKRVTAFNQPALEQEKSNEKFVEQCKREEREAEAARVKEAEEENKKHSADEKKLSVEESSKDPPPPPTEEELNEKEEEARRTKETEAAAIEAEKQAEEALAHAVESRAAHQKIKGGDASIEDLEKSLEMTKEAEKAAKAAAEAADVANALAKLEVVDRGIKTMCLTEFNPSKEHVDCSGLVASKPIIFVYDLKEWDVWSSSSSSSSSPGEEEEELAGTKGRPKFLERFDILKYPTAIPKCWSYLEVRNFSSSDIFFYFYYS